MNGFLNGYYLGYLAPEDAPGITVNVVVGLALFFLGMYINQGTDSRLIALRKKQGGYQIPKGWLFKYISCPNHFGEIVEWAGFAILAWSVPAVTFAVWTFCNLVPRALNHHEWYQENFEDYPKDRKAVLPKIW
jgi:steroid 5-alpha reductase family enzyme